MTRDGILEYMFTKSTNDYECVISVLISKRTKSILKKNNNKQINYCNDCSYNYYVLNSFRDMNLFFYVIDQRNCHHV